MIFRYLLCLLVLLLFAHCNDARALELRPASLDHLSLDVTKFLENREPMTPQIGMKDYRGRVRLNFNVGLLNDLIKFRNEVHTEGTDAKVETVGWHFVVAIPLPGGLEPFYEHHSRHVMDMDQPTIAGRPKPEKFAVEDSYGLRITFFERKDK